MKHKIISFLFLLLLYCVTSKKKCVFLLIIMFFLFQSQISSQEIFIQPIERNVEKLNISIDPRMELLSTIQLLSNYSFINREIPYSKKIIKNFKSFKNQKAVKMTNTLFKKYGFSYDAPVEFMLYLSQPLELKRNLSFSDYLLERAENEENLEQYRKSIKEFAEKTNFISFWNKNIPFYHQILDRTVTEMNRTNWVQVLENYYNETRKSYNIIISPALKGGYGPCISDNDGINIYACIPTESKKDETPYLNNDVLLHYVWHEFSHSFVNPLTEKYAEQVAVSEKLFEPIIYFMHRKAYTDWKSCVNEHIIRAIEVRLYELYVSEEKPKEKLNNEIKDYFIYIEPLIEKLKEFEKQRDEKDITFSDFYPNFLNLFDSLVKIEYWKEKTRLFAGPINAVQDAEKIAYIYPTYNKNKKALKIVQDYSLKMFNNNENSKEGLFLSDSVALQTDLSDYGIFAYGTMESNLFLKQHADAFPFKIENKKVFLDKEYKGKHIRLITCVPNPLNHEKGMFIYTALSNKSITDFNIVRHGKLDFILFLNKNYIAEGGLYRKNEKWEF